jgi:hypothetical protein
MHADQKEKRETMIIKVVIIKTLARITLQMVNQVTSQMDKEIVN